MDQQHLAYLIDKAINDILNQQNLRPEIMRVVLTGDEQASIVDSLKCIDSLYEAGYGLSLFLSQTAAESFVKPACLAWRENKKIVFPIKYNTPEKTDDSYYGVFLPAISMNSVAKIALCIRDNIASECVFRALACNKPVFVTLSIEFQKLAKNGALALRQQLVHYIDSLEGFGIKIVGQSISSDCRYKRLITLQDILVKESGDSITIEQDVLITPAAKDEIKRRNIILKRIN